MKVLIFFLFLALCTSIISLESYAQLGETAEFTDNVTIFGSLNVTGARITLGGIDVCLSNGSNCLNGTVDTRWNINGSNYLINRTGILDVNESKLNATITSITQIEQSYWQIAVMLAIILCIFSTYYNFSLLQKEEREESL